MAETASQSVPVPEQQRGTTQQHRKPQQPREPQQQQAASQQATDHRETERQERDQQEPERQQEQHETVRRAGTQQQEQTSTPESGSFLVSYVLPVYNEVDGIRRFHEELSAATAHRPEHTYEFVYVNDGSSDNSLAVLRDLARHDSRVHVIDFARNFGHQIAITAGLDHSAGDAVIVMDTDLQDPPAVSLRMIDTWLSGAEIVSARRRTRRDTWFKRWTAHGYYRVLRRSADVDIPLDTGDFRLLDRRAAQELRGFRERSRFLRGMVASMGFDQAEVLFDREARAAGATKYPVRKMLRLAADGVTSFSTAPLKLITRIGFASLALSLLGIIYAVTLRVVFPQITVSGWTMLMVVMLFLGGVQMLSLGVIGSYIGRIYSEVQQRPLYIVRSVIRYDEN